MKKVLLIALVAVCAMGCCKKAPKQCCGQCEEGKCEEAACAVADSTSAEVVVEEVVETVAE